MQGLHTNSSLPVNLGCTACVNLPQPCWKVWLKITCSQVDHVDNLGFCRKGTELTYPWHWRYERTDQWIWIPYALLSSLKSLPGWFITLCSYLFEGISQYLLVSSNLTNRFEEKLFSEGWEFKYSNHTAQELRQPPKLMLLVFLFMKYHPLPGGHPQGALTCFTVKPVGQPCFASVILQIDQNTDWLLKDGAY